MIVIDYMESYKIYFHNPYKETKYKYGINLDVKIKIVCLIVYYLC